MKFLSLAALEVVILITSSAANDEKFMKMTTFPFQWMIFETVQLIFKITACWFINVIQK